MDIYKLASQQQLRFQTSRGPLSTEQLWDLGIEELDTLAVNLEKEHEQSGRKSFIVKKSQKDKVAQMKFDIVLDVLNTKIEAEQIAAEIKEKKEHNKKILTIIAEKKDAELKSKSIEELESMIK